MTLVIVTGAGQGMGAADARLPAASGATVIGLELAHVIGGGASGAEYQQLDVTDQAGWQSLAGELAARFGRVDGLVANAGITWRARRLDVDRLTCACRM